MLHGRAVDSKTAKNLKGTSESRMCAHNASEIDAKAKMLVGRVAKKVSKSSSQASSSVSGRGHGFYTSVPELEKMLTECCDQRWSESTKKGTVKYMIHSLLPRMDEAGIECCSADLAEIFLLLIKKAVLSKRSRASEDTAENSVGNYIARAAKVYACVRDEHPDLGWPELDFPESSARCPATEQIKSIPDPVRVRLAELMFLQVKDGLTMGVAMMLFGGLRTGEAAAPLIGELIDNDTFVSYWVLTRLDGSVRSMVLKTESAYRLVVMPLIMVHMLRARIEYLKSCGHDENEIKNMPLVSGTDCTKFAGASKLSEFAKNMLLKAGITKEMMEGMNASMRSEPVFPDGKKERDICAYILRRDWVTRAANVCGIPNEEVDYSVGHKRKDSHMDHITDDAQRARASRLENYVFSPYHTRNPKFTPVALRKMEFIVKGAAEYRFELPADSEDMLVTLDLSGCEPGSEVSIVGQYEKPDDAKPHRKKVFDSPEERSNRPILGKVMSKEYYDTLIKEAATIKL